MARYSEPYSATGGLAAEGVLNQLGRPNIEPLEVLVREAVQNCWDAKRDTATGIVVEIGRQLLSAEQATFCKREILVDPPPGLPLADVLRGEIQLMYFADYGTNGLGGPTRADETDATRDFIDFVRNIGQPSDKDLSGGSFGYGKAAFYIASRARTILVDTLCRGSDGKLEHRFIACALGNNFDIDGLPHTGRHWWGEMIESIPEPLIGDAAVAAARGLGLPDRQGEADLGTTVVVIAPGVTLDSETEEDDTMSFVAEAVAWDFWPRMIDTPGSTRRTIEFRVVDRDKQVRVPNPRTHERLRGFVEAMDRLREEPGDDDDFLIDRDIGSLRPIRRLGRVVIQRGPVAPVSLPERPVPSGAKLTSDTVHHVALMRNAELVVRYLPGPVPLVARTGYAGVFRCAVDVDEAFRKAEPPTHDDWVYRAVPNRQDRSFVKIALERINSVCREAAGYEASMRPTRAGADVPLGEFADSMATLMPGVIGPGARRSPTANTSDRRRRTSGRPRTRPDTQDVWVDGATGEGSIDGATLEEANQRPGANGAAANDRAIRPPQLRSVGDPSPTLAADGRPAVRYSFELRSRGNPVRLSAAVEVMSSDGAQVEAEAPVGTASPSVIAWIDPAGVEHAVPQLEASGDNIDGLWAVIVTVPDEALMRADLKAEAI
jgi:hypothetical protein